MMSMKTGVYACLLLVQAVGREGEGERVGEGVSVLHGLKGDMRLESCSVSLWTDSQVARRTQSGADDATL